jgi:hypothetical protein
MWLPQSQRLSSYHFNACSQEVFYSKMVNLAQLGSYLTGHEFLPDFPSASADMIPAGESNMQDSAK